MLLRPFALALSLTIVAGCGGGAQRAPIPVPVSSVPVADVSPTEDPNYDPNAVTEEPDYVDPSASPSPSVDPSASPSPDPSATASPSPSPSASASASASASPSPSPSPTPTPDPYGNTQVGSFTGFDQPAGVAVLAGQVYVTDYVHGLFKDDQGIVRVLSDGQEVATIKGSGSAEFPESMTAVAVSGATVFTSATSSNYIFRFAGSVIGHWLETGVDAVDLEVAGGYLFVANKAAQKITRLNLNGTVDTLNFITGINPVGLATDGLNNLLVTDATTKTVRKFNATGQEVLPAMSLNDINTPGDLAFDANTQDTYVMDAGRGVVKRFMSQGGVKTFGTIRDPRRMAIADDGTLYVVDGQLGDKKVIQFEPGKYPN